MDWRECVFFRLLVPIAKLPSKNTVPVYITTEGEISWHPYMWNLKRNDANELTEQKETCRLREWTYGCWGGLRIGEDLDS